MNVRASIVTVGMTLALLAPTFTGAAAADPWFRDGTTASTPSVKTSAAIRKSQASKTARANQHATTTKVKLSSNSCPFDSPRLCRQVAI